MLQAKKKKNWGMWELYPDRRRALILGRKPIKDDSPPCLWPAANSNDMNLEAKKKKEAEYRRSLSARRRLCPCPGLLDSKR